MRVKHGVVVAALLASAGWPSARAEAQAKKPARPEGVRPVLTVKPDKGYVDDAYAFDGSGGRLAVVRAEAGEFAEIEVLDLNQGGASLVRIDVTASTTSVAFVGFVLDGAKFFVVDRPSDADRAKAFVIDGSGKVLRRWGPATDIRLATVEGVEVAAVFDARPAPKGGTTYEVAVYRLDNGKLMGKKRQFKADAEGYIKALQMKVLFWQQGYTQLVGQRQGQYDRYEDQRGHDTAAVYDVVAGTIVRSTPIKDLIEYTKIVKLRVEHANERTFVVVAEDLKALEVIGVDDTRVRFVTTEQPLHHYDLKSLRYQVGGDGRIWFTLDVDPVNPDAVARKIADPEHIDLYVFDPASGKAQRVARLPKGDRPFSWRVATGRWALLRKHKGFGRGGPELEIYDLAATTR